MASSARGSIPGSLVVPDKISNLDFKSVTVFKAQIGFCAIYPGLWRSSQHWLHHNWRSKHYFHLRNQTPGFLQCPQTAQPVLIEVQKPVVQQKEEAVVSTSTVQTWRDSLELILTFEKENWWIDVPTPFSLLFMLADPLGAVRATVWLSLITTQSWTEKGKQKLSLSLNLNSSRFPVSYKKWRKRKYDTEIRVPVLKKHTTV